MNFQKIIEPPTTIKVALRIKPTSFSSNWLEIKQDNTEIILKKQTNKNFNFKFDKIFDQNSIQQEIYQKCAKSLVDAFIFGFNSTILAYGQTGSGKTFTMGTTSKKIIGEDCLGILPRLMNDIWNYVKAEKILRTKIKVSFLEIYNEEIMDLLLGNTYSKVKR